MVNSIALLIVLSSVNAQQIRGLADDCPQGYLSREGDVPGYGTEIKGKQNTDVVTDCSSKCDIDPNCCSFEWSPTTKLCNLNRTCEPTQAKYKDYYFCTKGQPWQDSQPTCPTGYTKCGPTDEYPDGCCDFDSNCLCDKNCDLIKYNPFAAGDQSLCSFSIYNCDKICEASAKDGKDGCQFQKLPNGLTCTPNFRNGWDRCNYIPGSSPLTKLFYGIESTCITGVKR
jgi:hypothetical protein